MGVGPNGLMWWNSALKHLIPKYLINWRQIKVNCIIKSVTGYSISVTCNVLSVSCGEVDGACCRNILLNLQRLVGNIQNIH